MMAVDRASPRPLYRQICQGYRDAIVDRRLPTGQRLPSTRSLAAELRISRIPVLSAFEQLVAEGYFESRVGSGTFVAAARGDEPPGAGDREGRGRASSPPGARRVSRNALAKEPEPWLGAGGRSGSASPRSKISRTGSG